MTTVTVKLKLATLPLTSVAVQLTVVQPIANADPEAGVHPNVTPGQLSVTAGVKFTTRVQAPAMFVTIFAGHTMAGGWVSLTVTFCAQLAVLVLVSVTVQVTMVTPFGNDAGALLLTLRMPQLSLATGVPRFTLVATHKPGEVLVTTSAGQVMLGGTFSSTTRAAGALVTELFTFAAITS